jgi:hypothetical protein
MTAERRILHRAFHCPFSSVFQASEAVDEISLARILEVLGGKERSAMRERR